MRRREGVDLKELLKYFGWEDIQIDNHLISLKIRLKYQFEMGLIKQIGSRFFLTDPNGMELSNQILVQILIWWESLNDYSFD